MSFLRTDQQVALNDLLIESQVSADHYHEAAEFLDDEDVAAELRQLGDLREALAERIEEVIRATGDLPSAPDKDRETGQTLIQRLQAAFSPDEVEAVIEQRLAVEKELRETAAEAKKVCRAEEYGGLLYEIEGNIDMVARRLESLLEDNAH